MGPRSRFGPKSCLRLRLEQVDAFLGSHVQDVLLTQQALLSTYIYIHIYIYTYIYIYIHTYKYLCSITKVHISTIYVCAYTYAHLADIMSKYTYMYKCTFGCFWFGPVSAYPHIEFGA